MEKKSILLITNSREDNQQSMLRFSNLLSSYIPKSKIQFQEVCPTPKFQSLFNRPTLEKWGGYLDKYFLFPKRLLKFLQHKKNDFDLIHIIDHSNSVYLPKISEFPVIKLITCHDLIAIRTAKGDFPEAPVTSFTGKRLQKWIKNSLTLADFFACDSSQTKLDLNQIIPSSNGRSEVIHLGVENQKQNFNNKNITLPFDPITTFYLLHVGSAAWYKNRGAVIQAFKNFGEQTSAPRTKLVLVGPNIQDAEVNPETLKWLKENKNKVTTMNHASEQELHFLYKNANVFLFPSLVEGFGWPPLEASSHGCPVITTRTGAISDILGDSAVYVDPNNQEQLNHALIDSLKIKKNKPFHPSIPSAEECAFNYAELYEKLIQNS
jgi:glycosyltransferase involved in cell wall biosynthesis